MDFGDPLRTLAAACDGSPSRFSAIFGATMSESGESLSKCPGEQAWRLFVAGKLSSDETQTLRAHSESCTTCQSAVQRITATQASKLGDSPAVAPSTSAPNETAKQFTELTNTKLFQRGEFSESDPGTFVVEEFEFDHTLLTASTQPESLGRLGKYEVHKIIGSGAFGVVLKAFDEQLRRAVAIKILNRQFSSSATARRRFIREARAAAAVSHTNVVAIHAVEEQAGIPFLVMELVTGPSLRDRISILNKLPPIEVIRLGAQIASGLAAAHAQGVVHRDIKPGNIMLENSLDRVKITDFGLARVAIDNIELTSRGMAMGTPAYMSPEQVAGDNDKVDGRSDLFALGCVLFAALVGHSPFQGRTALEMARRVTEYDPVPLTKLDSTIPQFLSDLVERLLKKKPEDRYQSAAEVASLLNRYLIALNQAPSDRFQSVIHDPLLRTQAIQPATAPRRSPRVIPVVIALVSLIVGFGLWQLLPNQPNKNGADNNAPKKNATTNQSGEPDEVDPTSDTVVVAAEPQELTVSQSGDAQFQTLNDALAKATPQTTIRVLDDATYHETLRISGLRFAGLKLITDKRATLAPRDPSKPTPRLVDISHVNDVVLSGWKINAPKDGHAIYVAEAGIVSLQDLVIEQPEDVGIIGAIQIHGMRSHADGTVEVRNCHVKTAGEGHCVWIHGTNRPPQEIRLTGNRFERRSTVGTNVVVWLDEDATFAKLVMTENLFVGGHSAINMFLHSQLPSHSLSISNNTFFESRNWLTFDTFQPTEPIARIANNLIVGGERMESPNLDDAIRHWEFRSNWWELGSASDPDPGRGAMIAISKPAGSLQFLSRDSNHKDFLRPAPDADWLESGAGGADPKFIGAFGPRQPP